MMEGSNTLPSGSYGIPRQPVSTKAKQNSQFQPTLNLQQIVQMQSAKDQAANNHKNSSASLYHTKNSPMTCKPPMAAMYDNAGSSAASTPNHLAQQQRALTQLYQQSAQTPLSTSKQYGQSSKQWNSNNTPSVPKQSSKSHHSAASSKKDVTTKQVDLKAKFATLLKQSKDMQKQREIHDKLALAQAQFVPNSGKQDKKGEKRDFEKAAVARNQLFGESCHQQQAKNQGMAQKEATSSAKQGKDAMRNTQASPTRLQQNQRQTPLNQQMLIIQNSGASPIGGKQFFMNTIDSKTSNSNYNHQSLIQGVSKPGYFPRQVSQTIPTSAVENLINSYQGAQRPQHEAQTREAGGRTSQQYHSTTRATSTSQTRSKKRVRAQNTSGHLRPNQHQNNEVPPLSGGQTDQRNPTIHKTSVMSTKSKKKKQQPSQQQTGIDPIEEYLANATRLIHQTKMVNGQSIATNSTPEVNQEALRPPEETGAQAALQSLQSHSMQTLINHNATSNFAMTENQESLILAQVKAKCQQEMQAQTKQAVAKLLYTKREILMELKALQASFKAQIQVQASQESSRSHLSSQQVKTEPNLNKKDQQKSTEMVTQLTELAIKELIKQHAEKTEATFKADIQENNEQMEERIDDILVQIQGIISGLEDTIYSRFEKVENQMMVFANDLEALKSDQQVQIARSIAQKSLDSLNEFQSKAKNTFVDRDSFTRQMEEFYSKIEEQIQLPRFQDKHTDSQALSQAQLAHFESKIQELQNAMAEEAEQTRLHQIKEQEERLSQFQEEISQLVANSLQETWQDFEQFSVSVRDDVQAFMKKELLAKEQKMENKMEKTKQQFLKAINGNMRVLDNLISDYTTRTREQIKNQLRTGASSRTKSNQLHRSNQEQDILEELQSLHGSTFSAKSNSKQLDPKQYQFNIDAVTAQSQQLARSLSSVQDVSESIRHPTGEADQSSQLLSTARDRLNQQEALQSQSNEQKLRGVIRDTTISNEHASRVPQLNINGMMPRVVQSSNSERLSMPKASLGTGAAEATGRRSGNPLFQDVQDYNTPEKTLLQTFKTLNLNQPYLGQDHGQQFESRLDMQEGHKLILASASPQMIVVEEQKFTQSQEEEESSMQNQVQSGIPSPEPAPQSEGSRSLQEQDLGQSNVSSQQSSIKYGQQQQQDRAEISESRRRRETEEKMRREEEFRQLMDGDLEERSMDQIKLQMEHGNVLPMVLRKTVSLMPKANDETSRLCSKISSSASAKEETDQVRDEIDQVETIDYALSTTNYPYNVMSGRGLRASQDSNSLEEGLEGGTVYNFGYNSMQTSSRVDNQRSLSMKNPKGAISMRLKNVVSPVQIVQAVNKTRQQTGSSSVCKQENTDSEFWNLTVDDESQIDPVLVMRNLNYTNLNSGATSVMHIQEANNQTGSQKQSFVDSCFGDGRPGVQNAIKVRERAYQLLDIDQLSREQNQAILTEEPYQVQLINNDGNYASSDAHIQEFSPVTSTPLDMQRSFSNSEGDDDGESEARRSRSVSQDDLREQLNENNRSGTRPFEEAKFENNSISVGDMETGEDRDLSDMVMKADGMISSLRQTANSTKMQPQFTSQQARRSAMVPMMEERTSAAQSLHEQSQISSKSNKQMQARSGMKIGTELPLSLQRQGNEIIHQILLDEVFAALDEVLGLNRDKHN